MSQGTHRPSRHWFPAAQVLSARHSAPVVPAVSTQITPSRHVAPLSQSPSAEHEQNSSPGLHSAARHTELSHVLPEASQRSPARHGQPSVPAGQSVEIQRSPSHAKASPLQAPSIHEQPSSPSEHGPDSHVPALQTSRVSNDSVGLHVWLVKQLHPSSPTSQAGSTHTESTQVSVPRQGKSPVRQSQPCSPG